ncbi:hypothetical protein [Streptomyces albicerus]|nr:hypothetical protein [Streptomyces albicerus]
MDISDDSLRLDPVWLEIDNNVCGLLSSGPAASSVAERLAPAGS